MTQPSTTASTADATVDLDRQARMGVAEVIYGEGKTPEQILRIAQTLQQAGQNVLVTRCSDSAAAFVTAVLPQAQYFETARVLQLLSHPPPPLGNVAVVAAGTSDLPVVEECAVCLSAWGVNVDRILDVGVAGIHRTLSQADRMNRADVVIVVAGMEGALPSVIGGLVKAPIIAVPTSVGYGANFSGLSALLGMLNACASGVTVVNIDNGFGAAFAARRILASGR